MRGSVLRRWQTSSLQSKDMKNHTEDVSSHGAILCGHLCEAAPWL